MNQELVDYIKQQMSLSVSKNKITDILLQQGWQQAELDEAFVIAENVLQDDYSAAGSESSETESNDLDEEDSLGGGNKKIIWIGAVALVIILIVAAVLAFSSQGKKEPTTAVNKEVENQVIDDKAKIEEASSEDKKEAAAKEAENAGLKKLEGLVTAPDGWKLKEGIKNSRPMVGYFKPEAEKDASGKEIFTEYIILVSDSLKANGVTDAAAYVAKSKERLKGSITDFKIIAEKPVTLKDGSAGNLIGASYTENGNTIRSIQLFAFRGDDVYLVTGFALESNWKTESDMFGAAVLSFKFPGDK